MVGEDSPSLVKRGDRLRRGSPEYYSALKLHLCFPFSGSVFICPEYRGQTVTQGGLVRRGQMLM